MTATHCDTPMTGAHHAQMERGPLRDGPVVVAADGAHSAFVLRAGALVGAALEREVTVVAAIDAPQQVDASPGAGMYLPCLPESHIGAARRRIHGDIVAAGAAPEWPLAVETGSAPVVLSRAVNEAHAAVLVMGLGRHRPFDRLLGSETAIHTARHAESPLLAVPSTFERMPSVAVVGVDFSNSCRRAIDTMLPFLGPDATVHLIHVWAPGDGGDDMLLAQDETYRRALPALFDAFVQSLALPAFITVRTAVREGRPAERLLDFAEAHHAELIVVGRHGRRLLERLFVDSVASRVLRGARCSVLVVPGQSAHTPARSAETQGWHRLTVGSGQWAEHLDAFTRRNAGRITFMETSDPEGFPYSHEQGFPLFGVCCTGPGDDVEIVLGEADGRRRHVKRVVSNASAISVFRDDHGADRALLIASAREETLLTLLPTVPDVVVDSPGHGQAVGAVRSQPVR